MDYSLLGSSIHGILQARILEWVAMPSSRGSSWPRDQTRVFYVSIGRQVLYHWEDLLSPCLTLNLGTNEPFLGKNMKVELTMAEM